MALPAMTCFLTGRDDAGAAHATTAPCEPLGPLRRTIGLFGDEARVKVPADAIPTGAGGWDLTKAVSITFGQDDGIDPELVTLDGYYIVRIERLTRGELVPAGGGIVATEYLLVLHTLPRRMREARGGLLTIGTLNPLGRSGRVDTDHDDYRTYQQLVDICLDALGVAHDAAPASLNTAVDGATTLTGPGPLDWGNARAIDELEALLAATGHTAVLANDGSKISVVRLHRAGETLTIPPEITNASDGYSISGGVGLRGSTIVVTSGRTRATIVTSRDLDNTVESPLEWVAWDERTGAWLNNGEWTALYSGESAPGDITLWRKGPDPAGVRAFVGLFSAVRLTGEDLARRSRFIAPAEIVGDGADLSLAGSAAVLWAKCCRDEGQAQFRNLPTADTDDPIRLGGVQAISGEGVFVLPGDFAFVRMDVTGGVHGTYADADELADDDLVVMFAHEANTGDHQTDYFVAAFEVSAPGGVLTVTELVDADLDAAIADPLAVKIEAAFLRHLGWQGPGDAEPTWINTDDLKEVAEQIALQRAGAAEAKSTVIPIIGIADHEPGSIGGLVTAVEWDWLGNRTNLMIGMHETPSTFYERMEANARRSTAAGARRFSAAGSAAGAADTRAGSTPGDLAGTGGGGDGSAPEAMSGTRGRDAAIGGRAGPKPPGARPGEHGPRYAEQAEILAEITGSTLIEPNRWKYDWREVRITDEMTFEPGDRTSAVHGYALNTAEANNSASGTQGQGNDIDLLTGTCELKPIRGNCVRTLTGPRRLTDGTRIWTFAADNAIDGTPAT